MLSLKPRRRFTICVDGELQLILEECLSVFTELRGLGVKVCYKPLRRGVLGQTRIKKQLSVSHGKNVIVWSPVIEVSRSLKKLRPPMKQKLLRYVLVHELVHILRSHLSRPVPSGHEKDFESEVQYRLSLLQSSKKGFTPGA